MAHSNIANFTDFLEKFQGVTDAKTEIKKHALRIYGIRAFFFY